MSSKTELAKTAVTAAAPELAIPVEAALAIASSVRGRREAKPTTEARGDVVLVPPPERPLLLELRKQRVRVVTKKGVRIVQVDPARGLTAGETIVAGTVVAAGYGIYVAAKTVNQDIANLGKPPSWWNPGGWLKSIGL